MELDKLVTKIKDLSEKVKELLKIREESNTIDNYFSNKILVGELVDRLLKISGTGNYVSYYLLHSRKRDLIDNIRKFAIRLADENLEKISKLEIELNLITKKMNDPKKIVLDKIRKDEAELVGEGPWVKDSAYRVYKVDEKFYSIIVYDSSSLWLMDESLEEISESQIENYI